MSEMFSKKNNPLLKVHYWLKDQPKFIHLCWWFKKHNLPIPPYFIGGTPNLTQTHYGHSDDDNSDPDNNSYTIDSERTNQATNTNFILRFQVVENDSYDSSNDYVQLYGSTSATFASGVFQVTTDNSTNPAHIPATGTLSSANNVSTQMLGSQTQTWQDGWSIINADESGKYTHNRNFYTEHCFAVQLNDNSSQGTSYYFRCYYSGDPLTTYSETAMVTSEAAQRRVFITHN